MHKFAEFLQQKKHEVVYATGQFPNSDKVRSRYKNVFIGGERAKSNAYISLLEFSLKIPVFTFKNKGRFDVIVEDQSPFFVSMSPIFHERAVIQFQVFVGKEALRRFPPPANFLFMLNELLYHRLFRYGVFMCEPLVKMFGWDKMADGKKYSVIWSGVDEENFFSKPEEQNYILFSGRISEYMKGIDTLLKAFSKLKKEMGDNLPYLVIAGDGPDRSRVERKAEELGVKDKLKITGWLYDRRRLSELYSKCMFCVLPSRYEGFGLSVLEGASFGKTSVISDIVQFSWARHFTLTFRKEDANDLAQKMKMLITHKELRKELGGLAREFAKDKTWKKVSQEFERFLLSLL